MQGSFHFYIQVWHNHCDWDDDDNDDDDNFENYLCSVHQLLILMSEWYLIMWIYNFFLTYSLTDDHFGYFIYLAIMRKPLLTFMHSCLLGKCCRTLQYCIGAQLFFKNIFRRVCRHLQFYLNRWCVWTLNFPTSK